WFYCDKTIKSAEAIAELRDVERKLLVEHLRVLNIQENKHPLATLCKKTLRALRKQSKQQTK
ncbi:MAG: hypothetical protein J5700_00840, partial [Treponema sp.]|nr:hypothetical protein [Treponema sp.]